MRISALCVAAVCASAQSVPVLDILERELNRNFTALKAKGDPPPYFISYTITEVESEGVSGAMGALQTSSGNRNRFLDVSVRIGSPQLDNYHLIRGERPRFAGGVGVALDNSPQAISRKAWLETDRVYRAATQRLINVAANQQTNAKTDKIPDFSAEAPEKASALPPKLVFNRNAWAAKVRRWSGLLGNKSPILTANVSVQAQRETKYFVDTEGTRIEHGRVFARIMMSAQGKAADGMDLITTESFESAEPEKLPDDAKVEAAIEKVQKDLLALLRAPLVEPYVGPAILSGRAAGVFFHEIFGHRIEGHRQRDETEGQTFAKSVGTPVLPDFLSVSFDPTRKQVDGIDLNGTYSFDDEGVKARPLKLVEAGTLMTFLMSRTPIEGFPKSNGHGRKQPGAEVVSRQSNLIVESAKQLPAAQLRQMLLDEVKRQNKAYGLYFEHVTGGYTTTRRSGLQAYTVIPLVVYRVWADGRPDELMRGADIVGTPLASFAKIVATSDKTGVFNGYCGAESGMVPVSAVSPALLVSEIEIQKKDASQDRPPFLPKPGPRTE